MDGGTSSEFSEKVEGGYADPHAYDSLLETPKTRMPSALGSRSGSVSQNSATIH